MIKVTAHMLRWRWRIMVLELLLDIARSLWFIRNNGIAKPMPGDLANRMPFERFSEAENIINQYEKRVN